MSDPINNLRVSGQYNTQSTNDVGQTEKPVNRFELLTVGGDEVVGITGQMKSGKVKVEVGEGQNAPDTHGSGKARGKSVKEFFQKIGAGISGVFHKATDGIRKLVDDYKLRNVEALKRPDMGKAVAEAVQNGDVDALKKAVKGMGMEFSRLQVENSDRMNYSLVQVVDNLFEIKGSEGVSILPGDVDKMKEMLPELRKTFASDPAAMLVLDKLAIFDFREAHIGDLNKHLSGLRNVDDVEGRSNMGTFLRGNTFFSAAMKADQLRTFDPQAYGKSLVEKNLSSLNTVVDMAIAQNERGGEQITKLDNSLGNPLAEQVLFVVRDVLDDMVKVDGPGGMKERFGEEHLAMLKDAADHIAAQEDILPELRNQALFKLYNNDLFLRGVIPALITDPGAQSVPLSGGTLVASLVQSILNDASGGKMSDDMRDGFIELRDEYQTKLTGAFMQLGMPVVGVD